MNAYKILAEIERLMTEIILSLIYIPKTIFKILRNPSWVPTYIDQELENESRKFEEYISPIMLLLASTLLMFYLLMQAVTIAKYVPYNSLLNAVSPTQGEEAIPMVEYLRDSNSLLLAVGFMISPVIYTLIIELIGGSTLTRSRVKRSFYIQCFLFSPIYLCLFFLGFLAVFWGAYLRPIHGADKYLLWWAALVMLFMLTTWFALVQTMHIRREVKCTKRKAFLIFSGATILLLFVANAVYEYNTYSIGERFEAHLEKGYYRIDFFTLSKGSWQSLQVASKQIPPEFFMDVEFRDTIMKSGYLFFEDRFIHPRGSVKKWNFELPSDSELVFQAGGNRPFNLFVYRYSSEEDRKTGWRPIEFIEYKYRRLNKRYAMILGCSFILVFVVSIVGGFRDLYRSSKPISR